MAINDEAIPISPLCDFDVSVLLQNRHATTGVLSAITTGTVSFLIATSADPEAAAAHANLSGTATHIGDSGANFANGTWRVKINAADLTVAILDALFLGPEPFLHVYKTDDKREYYPLRYERSRRMTRAA